MKCAIVTISVGIMNYGNRLQNYALQEIIKSFGHSLHTIDYKPTYPPKNNNILLKKTYTMAEYKSSVLRKVFYLRNKNNDKVKRDKFDYFTKKMIKWTDKKYTIDSDLSDLKNEFDCIICGSDQVWNPYWEGTQPIYFMQFMSYEKRIAYAASFGVSSIPDDKKMLYQDYMNNIKYISCREDRGVEIVKELGNDYAVQVLDPVFLLPVEEWAKIEKKPANFKKAKYILAYFLGDIEKSTEKKLHGLRKQGYSIVYLDKRDEFNSIFASPEEFLYLVRNCSLLCTDSFHGCAFSIIFNKPFICFDRTLNNGAEQNMNSRITSLFKLFKCEDRFATRVSENPFIMDYTNINIIKNVEKEKSLDFLRKALNDEC